MGQGGKETKQKTAKNTAGTKSKTLLKWFELKCYRFTLKRIEK